MVVTRVTFRAVTKTSRDAFTENIGEIPLKNHGVTAASRQNVTPLACDRARSRRVIPGYSQSLSRGLALKGHNPVPSAPSFRASLVRRLCGFAAFGAASLATPALADPCEAPVQGYPPGAVISGQVRYVGDGDSLCLGRSSEPSQWVEIRLARWFAPELHEAGGRQAKAALVRAAKGRQAHCIVEPSQSNPRRTYSYDRVVASCRINGRPIAGLMRAAGVREGGRGR